MISDVVKLVGKLLEDTENWNYDPGRYTLFYKTDPSIRIWVANGLFFLSLYSYGNPEYPFNFYEKCYIWFKMRKVVNHLHKQFKKELNNKIENLAKEILNKYE